MRVEHSIKMLRKKIPLVVLVTCVLGLAAVSTVYAGSASLATDPKIIALDKKGKVTLKGSGFKSGQELRLLLTTVDGVKADIGHYLKPVPMADSDGNWSSSFKYGRFVKKKLIKQGDYELLITDISYKTILATNLTFKKKKKK